MGKNQDLAAFVRMSKYAGMREDLVQAGGGNSSFKVSPERMVIKASGYQLADITEEVGYALVNPKAIRDAFLQTPCFDALTDADGDRILKEAFIEGKRPSIETVLHSVSGTYTLHTHPIVVNAMACRVNGMEELGRLFPDALLVPYAKPGVKLAGAYFTEYQKRMSGKGKAFDVVFMQNHGLVVSGDTADEVIQKTECVVKRLENHLGINNDAYRNATELWELFPQKVVWRVTDKNVLDVYQKGAIWAHQICPDCIVFLGQQFLCLDESDAVQSIRRFRDEFGEPVVVIYKKQMYILADSVRKALETQSVLSFSGQVMKINEGVPCKLLSRQQQEELVHWDAEKYRKNVK